MPLRFLSPIHKATRQISIHLEERMRDLGIAPAEGHLLAFLLSYEPVPVSELIRVLGVKKTTMSSMLDRLAARHLVTRDVNHDDRRSFLVGLTGEGRVRAEKVNRPLEDLERRIAARVGNRDLRGFQSVMEAIAGVTRVRVRREASPPQRKGVRK